MFAWIIILTLSLAVPITLATAALFRPKMGAKTEPAPVKILARTDAFRQIEGVLSPLSTAANGAGSLD